MSMQTVCSITPETLQTEFVSPENCVFSVGDNGFLRAVVKGVEYKRVILTRALPLSAPDDYICIADVSRKEIGIIEHTADFPDDQKALIDAELSQRYFCPSITSVENIKEKMGHFYFDVKIGEFERSFTVKDMAKSVRSHGAGFDIVDVDGNRYRIDDFEKIPKRSRRMIEPYLY